MLGKTTYNLLKACANKKNVRVIDLGCGSGINIFDVYDVCAEFRQVQWYGLDLNQWLADAGLPVIRKVRGPMLFGSPFFDRRRFLSGMMIALDTWLDRLPGKFFTTTNLGLLCRNHSDNDEVK